MNSLQVWLAIVGGLVLAAVVGHGAWQTRRVGGKVRPPRLQAADPVVPSAAAVTTGYLEPSFEEAQAPTEPMPLDAAPLASPVEVLEQRLTAVPAALNVLARRAVAALRIDPLIDAIARLLPELPLSGEAVLAHWPPSRRAGGKPFLIEACNSRTGEWETPLAGQTYAELRAGLQLANRLGAVNEIEYSEFVQIIQRFAEPLSAEAEFPDMLDVVARARSLDRVAVHHDAQLAMRLTARHGQWPVSWIQQHAARHGFVSGPVPGRLILPGRDDGAPPVLALVFDAQAALAEDPDHSWVSEMALVFDVPQTPQAEQPFNAWCASGQALAIALDADVNDDEGRPLNAGAFTLIREDLDGLYAKLAEFELAAGSPAARRLFS
ncbi:cell division protein FtsZ [Sphaerotilus sp.]|uniref:cell division protein FtsZ n=1 Tax=Sphaerotilus sp. TaxID=2093942 RepID=UPI00286E9A19|nr:cell division protein FtsZ [Sphaerotilus sp.]